MTAILTDTAPPLSRRNLLKGGGALVVGFCIGGSALPGFGRARRRRRSAGSEYDRFMDRRACRQHRDGVSRQG